VSTATLYAMSCPPTGLVGQNGNANPSTAISQTETGISAYSNSGFGGTNLYGDLIATGGANYQVVNSNVLQTLVPLEVIPSNTSGVVYVAGEVVSGIGGSPAVVAQWPLDADSWSYVADSLTSCRTPLSSIH
jgi:hypothetical protein